MKLSELLQQRNAYYDGAKCFDAVQEHNKKAANVILSGGLVVFVESVKISSCEYSGESGTSLNEYDTFDSFRDFVFAVKQAGLNYRKTYGVWGYNKCNYTAKIAIYKDWTTEPECTEYNGRIDIGDEFDEDVMRNMANTIKRNTNKETHFIL